MNRVLPYLGIDVTHIDNSHDGPTATRIHGRLTRLLPGAHVSPTVPTAHDIELALTLVDKADAVANTWLRVGSPLNPGEITHAVLSNIAVRRGSNNHCVQFGYLFFRNLLIVTTWGGRELSLLKKVIHQETAVQFFQIPSVLAWAVNRGLITKEHAKHINESQFRTYDFGPFAVKWLLDGLHTGHDPLPSEDLPWSEVPSVGCGIVAQIDSHGNVKTTGLDRGQWPKMSEVKDGKHSFIRGSSGLDELRFIELIIKGARAADYYKLSVGQEVPRRVEQNVHLNSRRQS